MSRMQQPTVQQLAARLARSNAATLKPPRACVWPFGERGTSEFRFCGEPSTRLRRETRAHWRAPPRLVFLPLYSDRPLEAPTRSSHGYCKEQEH